MHFSCSWKLKAYFVRASEQQVNKTLNQSNKHLLFFQHDLPDLRFVFDSVALLVSMDDQDSVFEAANLYPEEFW